MGVIKVVIADGVLTFLWVFCSSNIGVATYFIASHFGVVNEMASLFITTLIVFLLFLVFGFLGDALGGAGFNPTGNAAFYAAGLGDDSLVSAAIRCPAQVAGAVAGSLAVMELMPKQYHHMLDGPALKVDVQAGAIAEGVLTFIITFMIFVTVLKGPKSALLKNWLLTMVTLPLVLAGANYIGPSMNPANVHGLRETPMGSGLGLPADNDMDSMDHIKGLEELDGHKIKRYNVWKVHQSKEKEEKAMCANGHLINSRIQNGRQPNKALIH